jgi:thiamine biosynthesis lipoprotein ApbE
MSVGYTTSRENRAFERNTNQAELFFTLRDGTIVQKKKKEKKEKKKEKEKKEEKKKMMMMRNRKDLQFKWQQNRNGYLVFPSAVSSNSGADKSLARPERKQATATEDFDVHISYS